MISSVGDVTPTRAWPAPAPRPAPQAASRTATAGRNGEAGPFSLRALRTTQALGRLVDPHDPVVLRATAAQFTAELFLKPLLADVRRFPFGDELGRGGQTESIFGEQLDQRVADNVAAADRGLLRAMVRELTPRATVAQPSLAAGTKGNPT